MFQTNEHSAASQPPIAIVGMSCMFPNAPGLREYWRLIRRGEDAIRDVPETHWRADDYVSDEPGERDMVYCARGGFLEPVSFNPVEFGIPPTILEATDTAQLLSLINAKRALDDAGYAGQREFNRARTSVILGVTSALELLVPLGARLGHPKWRRALRDAGVDAQVAEQVIASIADEYVPWQENSFPGLLGNVVAGRIANRLNLGGTNCVVDAACASSISAVHLASLELAAGRSDMVITGGVDTFNDIFMFMCFSKTQALSRSGDVRPFSADADGTVLGEGIGMLVLKRLADAERDGDRVYALLRGIGTSSDGRSQSIYAPRAEGQAVALREAYRVAGVSPTTVELVEAHGTGTKVGDVVEFEALRTVYREASPQGRWCALGSVKSQIGHAKAAAGAASLIKTVLALHHRVLPPTIKCEHANAKLELDASPFHVSGKARPWISDGDHPRRAGVSSFGFGGSNFHAVLEEHTHGEREPAWDETVQIIALSADDDVSLRAALRDWQELADQPPSREVLAHRAAAGRAAFSSENRLRLVMVLGPHTDLHTIVRSAADALESRGVAHDWHIKDVYFGADGAPGDLAFLFPGQGSQYVDMAGDLVRTFPEALDAIEDAHREGLDERNLAGAIYPPPTHDVAARDQQEATLTDTQNAQPALGAISLAMLRVLKRFGIEADFTAGHSYGELVALRAAGRVGDATLRKLSQIRAKLMGESSRDGAMLAVNAPLDEIDHALDQQGCGDDVVLANRNAPNQGILSGMRHAIDSIAETCHRLGWSTRKLNVSAAFHSKWMVGAGKRFRHALEDIQFELGRVPVFANASGKPYPPDADTLRDLLARQLSCPVLFMQQIREMYSCGVRTFVEVGPKAVLTGLVRSILHGESFEAAALDASSGRGCGITDLARVLALTAALGHAVDLAAWERPAPEPVEPGMSVTLVGANYRSPQRPTVRTAATQTYTQESQTPSPIGVGPNPMYDSGNGHAASAAPPPQTAPAAQPAPQCAAPPPDTVAHAFAVVQEGLRSMQLLQQQTAAAHQRFLETQDQAQRSFQMVMEQQRQLMQGVLGMPASAAVVAPPAPAPAYSAPTPPPRTAAPQTAPATATPPPRAVAPQVTPAVSTAPTLAPISNPVTNPGSPPDAIPKIAPAPAPVAPPIEPAPAQPNGDVLEPVMLGVVSELTGYPTEMIELDMDMEADLGIDSIKRLEILGEVQRRVPNLEQIDSQYLGSLRTLREISDYLRGDAGQNGNGHAPGGNGDAAHATTTNGNGKHTESALRRQVLSEVELAEGPTRPFEFAPDRIIWITDDGTPLAAALAKRIGAAGGVARVIDASEIPADSGETLGGLVILAPDATDDDADAAFLKQAFRLVRHCATSLESTAQHRDAFVITVSRLDGAFGLRGKRESTLAGGLAGLAKTLAWEFPSVAGRALDIDPDWNDPEALAAALLRELTLEGPLEVGLSSEHRVGLLLDEQPIEIGSLPLRKSDVVVVSGGARGVTADCAVALAQATRPTLILLGRSPQPTAEPDWLTGLHDEAAIKRALLANAFHNQPRPKPAKLERAFRAAVANREMLHTLERTRAAGATVEHHAVDIRDARAVAELLGDIRRTHGPIRGLIHGAGVLEDRLIVDKTDDQFDRVFDTKVAGAHALLAATRDDDLRCVALFSSVSGRFGRRGQVDYAMANEVLNKLAQREARRRPHCRVVSINWGPWDGGMVTATLRKQFETEGVGVIERNAGAQALLAEIAQPPGSPVEVVITSELNSAARRGCAGARLPFGTLSESPRRFTTTIDRRLATETHAFLESHRIAGRPVLPLAMSIEWLATAALHDNPGLHLLGLDDVRVLHGVAINNGALDLALHASALQRRDGAYRIDVELQSRQAERPHVRGVVRLGDLAPTIETRANTYVDALGADALDTPIDIYGDVLFHGTHFHVLEEITSLTQHSATARVSGIARPADWMHDPLRGEWLTDPLSIDAALQLGILWCHQQRGVLCLPSFVREYRRFAPPPTRPTTIVLRVSACDATRLCCDAWLLDTHDRPAAVLRGVEWTIDPSLQGAFGKHAIAQA